MPESHDRHKGEKETVVYRQNSPGEHHVIPHFDSDTSCIIVAEHCFHAVPEDSSYIKGVISHNEFPRDDSNAQATMDFLFNQTESDKIQNVSLLNSYSGINVDVTEEESDEEGEKLHGIRNVVSTGKELSLLSMTQSFTEGRSLGSSRESCLVQQSGLSISVVDQKAADIVYDTLRLIDEVLQLESTMPPRERSTVDAGIEEPQFTNQTISGIEKDSAFETQSLFAIATQEGSNIRGQSALNKKDEINSLFHSAPLIFPETSDIAISMATASITKNKRSSRKTSHLSDVETGITYDCAEITKTAFIDSGSGNPSESSLTDSNTRQFHIVVKTHPDGGWGWVVCLGAFLVQFIALGMQNSAGIVYTELVKELKSKRGATGSYQIHFLSLLLVNSQSRVELTFFPRGIPKFNNTSWSSENLI